ncbi:hypothetical protein D3C87_1680870 [compost metagenome]
MRTPINRPSAPRSPSPLMILGVICEMASIPCGSTPRIDTGDTASLFTRKALPEICGLMAETAGLARSSCTIIGQSRICLRWKVDTRATDSTGNSGPARTRATRVGGSRLTWALSPVT